MTDGSSHDDRLISLSWQHAHPWLVLVIVCSGRWLANTGSKEEELVSEGTLDRIGTLEDVARVVVRAHPCSAASLLCCVTNPLSALCWAPMSFACLADIYLVARSSLLVR